MYKYDKDEIKSNLTMQQVFELVAELGGEPVQENDLFFVSRTICHNPAGEGSHKLYYYDNTKLFRCYTYCGEAFDIYQLILKIKLMNGEKKSYWSREGEVFRDWELFDAVEYIAKYFGYELEDGFTTEQNKTIEDWKILNNYERIKDINKEKQVVELQVYDDAVLKYLPRPRIEPWEQEGITREAMNVFNIAYDPCNVGIVIPHYDMDNNLIGIRERTLIKEREKRGKYIPAYLDGVQYRHPLSFNLYGLNMNKDNIAKFQTAIVMEGEKSVLLYESYFGRENNICVACCGNSLIAYQVKLLLDLGVKEIVVGFDKDFESSQEENFSKVVKNLKNIHKKYGASVQISFLFDKEDLLGFKNSPIDKGKDVFLELFKRRIFI
jgi:hypothetical protein